MTKRPARTLPLGREWGMGAVLLLVALPVLCAVLVIPAMALVRFGGGVPEAVTVLWWWAVASVSLVAFGWLWLWAQLAPRRHHLDDRELKGFALWRIAGRVLEQTGAQAHATPAGVLHEVQVQYLLAKRWFRVILDPTSLGDADPASLIQRHTVWFATVPGPEGTVRVASRRAAWSHPIATAVRAGRAVAMGPDLDTAFEVEAKDAASARRVLPPDAWDVLADHPDWTVERCGDRLLVYVVPESAAPTPSRDDVVRLLMAWTA